MKTAYILHGRPDAFEYLEQDSPSPSNAHWIPWLQQKFLRGGIQCQALEMPTPYKPVYGEWAETFSQAKLKNDSIIVAHSAGGGFILKWLHEHPEIKIAKLLLVAPWLDLGRHDGDFLSFDPDQNAINRFGELHVLYSTDEPVPGIAESKDLILQTYPQARLHTFTDRRHFCFEKFEELWNICAA